MRTETGLGSLTPLAQKVLFLLEEKKGIHIHVLDMRSQVTYTDILVICSGSSTTHVHALVGTLREELKGPSGPVYVNSSKDDSWWILDFVDVVVHIFREDSRRFYDLDQFWGDAKTLVNIP